MKLKKLYKHDNKKQIWRIIPSSNKKLIVEERDIQTKEVYFNCLDINSGKKYFVNLQLDEKNWIGIESIHNDMIFFHTYGKPDMPAHKSIIAFDILTQSVIWQNNNYVFSFIYDNKVYCYQQRFEGRQFYALDYITGEVVQEFGDDFISINSLRDKSQEEFNNQNYFFPEHFQRSNPEENVLNNFLKKFLEENIIKGEFNYLLAGDLLFYNYHTVNKVNMLDNIFTAVDLKKNKIILKETLDKNLINLMPESFFVKDNLLFLIIDKTKLIVYQIKE